jgi:mannose-6-phosphate isomerase-like protein (cupin superfamily)
MRCRLELLVIFVLACHVSTADGQQSDTASKLRPVASKPSSPASRKAAAEKVRRRIDFIDGTTMTDQSAYLGRQKYLGKTLLTSGDEQTTYLLVRRAESSKPEVHARWDDIVLVRSGTGAIETGDSLVGSEYRGPGERAGGKFAKSYQLVVRPGDIVRIPAAVPHAFIVSGTVPLEYLVIKQRRQELPIRWFGR